MVLVLFDVNRKLSGVTHSPCAIFEGQLLHDLELHFIDVKFAFGVID